ncbi:broad-complex core protein isoforms 1/2/3/4/5 isoform X3 [Anabrus simplex]|uniref:broad-complex core protein isoforms 1/2/3/4/5 isoform X3 n=1 Tax=Anabrus simplex TaxID=316456 RepID=UPI0035A374B1
MPRFFYISRHVMMADTQHFCLRWNNYQSSITSAFENLRDDEDFVDVTLACDGKSLKAHRVVLSACSPYFRELLKSTPCKHPVIVLQDVAFVDLHALVEFIYHGEVNVHQRNLSSFLKTAEVLRVSGLTQQADDRDEFPSQTQGTLRGNMQHSFTDKLVEDALFTSPPSPPPATSGGATVQQLLRRAAAAAVASSNRRERHNSAEQQSDSSEQSQHATPNKRARTAVTSTGLENNSHNNGETTSASTNQATPTDFSTTPFPKTSQLTTSSGTVKKTDQESSGDHDSSSPSPTGGLLDGVKTEPVELLCGKTEGDNSNDSVEAATEVGGGSHQQSSQSAEDQQDHDSIQGHLGSAYLSTPESKLFGSVTSGGSFNFSMAALSADHSGLSGIANQSLQGNADGSAGTSSQELLGRGWASVGPPYCPLCRKSFTRAWSLQRHMADTHFYVPRSFECDVCGRSYRSRNSLVSHKSQYHGGTAGARATMKETTPPTMKGEVNVTPVFKSEDQENEGNFE